MAGAKVVLSIDVGGTSVKVRTSEVEEVRQHPSGPELTPASMVAAVREMTADWDYDVISVGFPGPVVNGSPAVEPRNLGPGWVGFDFEQAADKPVRVINDAAMQALGSYDGGKMLFLGLGTGLGSAIVIAGHAEPLELAHLPYGKDGSYEDYLGKRGLERLGAEKWEQHVHIVVELFKKALLVDYVVLGGGNANNLTATPEGARLGANANAFLGGFRMWNARSD